MRSWCHRCSLEHGDPVSDREIELHEIARCVRLVAVMDLWAQVWRVRDDTLAAVIWREELVPLKWH